MPIDLYPNISKVKRNGAWQNLPGFGQPNGDADIEAMIANKETSTTAQFAHAKDSFFILNNVLYQADANIAVNGTIAVGTNCHVSVLGDVVSKINNNVNDLKSTLDDIVDEEYPVVELEWEIGSIDTNTGEELDNQSRMRTDFYKESDYISVSSQDAETYVIRYSYDGNEYTFLNTIAVYGANNPYIFSADSVNYFRLRRGVPNHNGVEVIYRSALIADVIYAKTQSAQNSTDIEQIKSDIIINKTENIFGTTLSDGYLQWSDGAVGSLSTSKYSEYIEVEAGNILTYSLHTIGGVGSVIACYDSSKAYVQSASIKGIGNGSWNENTGTLTIPNGISYIRFATRSSELSNDSIILTKALKIKDYIGEIDQGLSWNAKKWAAFGTSITDTDYVDPQFLMPTGKYPPYLADMSGLLFTNYGIAGGSITTDIQTKVKQTTLTNFDIVTVEGSVNDHATSKPIGEVGDTGTDTFAGAIYQIAKYVYENSNATLFFITDYVGRYVHINPTPAGTDFYGDCAPTKTNSLDLLQIDYINMMIKQCEYFGIPCITAGQDSGINLLTGDLYLVDHIHSTYAGGKQYAQTIWNYLRNVKPRVLSV